MFILDERRSAEFSGSRVSQCWGQVCRGGRISLRPKETWTSVTGVLSGQQSVRTLGGSELQTVSSQISGDFRVHSCLIEALRAGPQITGRPTGLSGDALLSWRKDN